VSDLGSEAVALGRQWRAARITPIGELLQPGRITGTAARLGLQIFLVVCLWRALYATTTSSAGLNREQAVTYAVLAVLATQIRGLDRFTSRDTMLQHVQLGTILYWFLRPVPPRRYYMIRAIGDQAYGSCWVLLGYAICVLVGIVEPPVSAGAAAAFAVSLLLGQVTLYYLLLAVDLLCFWTMVNGAAVQILRFAQNLLSGVFAPLWFFPGWFVAASSVLPFQGTLNVPLSIYIGRIPLGGVGKELAVQAGWCLLLAALTRLMWHRAAQRVTVQGG
jgi:ABC-2 type transport system permease protein